MSAGTHTPHVLSGWKDIANYLGKGVRTVQRYELELRLPVRRPSGRARGSVVASLAELDAWVIASPMREERAMNVRADSQSADYRASLLEGIRRMRTLEERMMELRDDMSRSVSSLRKSIHSLRSSAPKDHRLACAFGADHSALSDVILDQVGDLSSSKAS